MTTNDPGRTENAGSPLDTQAARRIVQQTAAELEARMAQPLAPGLYLVATPIGNLGDITLRALVVLATADTLYCEDTRHSLKLLQRYAIARRLETYHEHNAARERPRILRLLESRAAVALISDAGTPLVSDPGYKLVRAVIEAGHAVHPIPGASAVLSGLVASGLPTDSFHFAGFLPTRSRARRARIEELSRLPGTLVLFEAPSRLEATFAELASVMGSRPAAMARELTKLNETFQRGSLAELAQWVATQDAIKGEVVILVGAGSSTSIGDAEVLAALVPMLAASSVKDAVASVASGLGVARSRVYDLAIAWRRDHPDAGNVHGNPVARVPGKIRGEDPC